MLRTVLPRTSYDMQELLEYVHFVQFVMNAKITIRFVFMELYEVG